ncbi:conserved hypothetical protein [Trichinella spiralis]|uniref:hypothetical protein n=1 Tax=Trichinella spiralis TaxID=6334 RepID=UPI0001EFE511|nr:conserved hypothetical protein [Trichinella spiralis]
MEKVMKCERNAKKYLTHLHRSLIDQNQLKSEHVAKSMCAGAITSIHGNLTKRCAKPDNATPLSKGSEVTAIDNHWRNGASAAMRKIRMKLWIKAHCSIPTFESKT